MIIGLRSQTQTCSLLGTEVHVKIESRLPMQRGLGGVLRPKTGGYMNVECERADECEKENRDCVWAIGTMRSHNDPLNLKITI